MTTARGLSDFVQFGDETILWTASLILLKHLQQEPQRGTLRGKRVLELGSGLGHLGLGLKQLGAHVTCTERPQELAALQANIARQTPEPVLNAALRLFGRPVGQEEHAGHSCDTIIAGGLQQVQSPDKTIDTAGELDGSIQAMALEWGQDGFIRSPLATQGLQPFDVIVCSELYYITSTFPDLLWTMRRLSGPTTIVWSAFIDRPFSFLFFALLQDEGCWDVEQIENFDTLGLDPELQVHMHRLTRRSQ